MRKRITDLETAVAAAATAAVAVAPATSPAPTEDAVPDSPGAYYAMYRGGGYAHLARATHHNATAASTSDPPVPLALATASDSHDPPQEALPPSFDALIHEPPLVYSDDASLRSSALSSVFLPAVAPKVAAVAGEGVSATSREDSDAASEPLVGGRIAILST